MKTTISIIVLAIVGVCVFSACTVLPAIAGALDPSTPPQDWAHKAHLAKLMKKPEKELLTEEEKLRAAKNICALKHLDKRKNINDEEAKTFCKLEKNDKIYFYDWCMECGGGKYIATSYLLVRDNKPFESIQIETKWSEKERKSFPIIERLH
jgi:hypothetical protein